ncbi:MAG: hypothetical protein IPN65_03525 [Elusimicrobia bacterium]|jgi:hypothetical protein|nr:hypothetical protein [Elusimicrobiota bacterium]MBK7208697.1 hypothetical protein [Elusimicrobiota bacterium]MBK7575544.1 hypothetical protein [Elusimicrobiota bacterium]MBK7688452.1 hypothetical protein [Elusimicrobiota bacterium]MBK8127128.1 hypothetical protein [Elusimicrobiota bacterium]
MTTGRRRGGEPRLGVVVRGVRWTVASSGEGAPAVFDLPAEDAAGAFRAFLRAHGFSARRAVLVLPQRLAVCRVLDLPSRNEREIASMAVLQAGRLLPLSPEEIATGHRLLRRNVDGTSRVLLMVVRRSEIQTALALCGEAGLAVESILLDLLVAAGATADGVVVRVVPGEAQIGVWENGAPVMLRGFPWGGDAADLAAEVSASLSALRRAEPGRGWGSMRLAGIDAGSAAADALRRAADVSSAIEWEKTDPADLALSAARGAVGPGLLPREERELLSKAVHRQGRRRAGFLLAAVLAAAMGLELFRSFRREDRLAALTREEKKLSALVAPVAGMAEALDRRAAATRESSAGNILRALEGALPAGVSLERLVYERGRRVQLHGEAPTLNESLGVVAALEKTGVFRNVELRGSDVEPNQGRERTKFQVDGSLGDGSSVAGP